MQNRLLDELVADLVSLFGADAARATIEECLREAGLAKFETPQDLLTLTRWLVRRRISVDIGTAAGSKAIRMRDPDQPLMSRDEHLEIGVAAAKRGFIDRRTLAEAMIAVGESVCATAEEIWLHAGRLTADNLRLLVSGARKTQLLSKGDIEVAQPMPAVPIRYAPVSTLGAGGMGEIWQVRDGELDRNVALKRLRPGVSDPATATAMLIRESRLTAGLEHPSIIPIYDAGTGPEGPYYIMRMVGQPTMEQVLDRLRAGDAGTGRMFTLHRLLRGFVQVCQAVDYAHSQRVIHCDLKPSNILLGTFGEVLVVDWALAYRMGEAPSYRGGTPGYMAPEQLDMATFTIDARTDVFALGAVLYEVLTLEPAFDDRAIERMRDEGLHSALLPPAPSERAQGERVPPAMLRDLDDVCVRAMSLDSAARPTASELAQAVETALEGTRERERRRVRAEELVTQADYLAARYQELLDGRNDRLATVARLRATTTAWDPLDKKRTLWEAEDTLEVTDHLSMRTLQEAASAYEQALDEVADHAAARRGLTRLYRSELHRAEERRSESQREYYAGLVQRYDDAATTDDDGRLWITCKPSSSSLGAKIALGPLRETDRRLGVAMSWSGEAPLVGMRLQAGRYQAVIEATEAHTPIRCPLVIRANGEQKLEIDLEEASRRIDGEIFVTGGPALLGDEELREVDVPSFFICEKPITFREYLEFLADLYRSMPDAVDMYAPRATDGRLYWRWTGGDFLAVHVAEWADGQTDLRDLPAFGMSARGAEAFATWKTVHSGVDYRLPYEDEWEKAARGTDGREFPWGDHFDASFCKMRGSRHGVALPEPPGSYPLDSSPYGVLDMAGGIADWVVPRGEVKRDEQSLRQLASRGGAWCDWPGDCRLGTRRTYVEIERSPRLGFRLARAARTV